MKSGVGNGRTILFASDEWRGGESNKSPDHTKLDEPQKVIDHEAPRGGQPQKRSAEARFLASRRLTSSWQRVACKLLPEEQKSLSFFSLSGLIPRNICIVRNYNRDYISFLNVKTIYCSAFLAVFTP